MRQSPGQILLRMGPSSRKMLQYCHSIMQRASQSPASLRKTGSSPKNSNRQGLKGLRAFRILARKRLRALDWLINIKLRVFGAFSTACLCLYRKCEDRRYLFENGKRNQHVLSEGQQAYGS